MVTINIDYTSQALKRKTEFLVLIPEETKPDNVLLLLHGRGDNKDAWIQYTNIVRYNKASLIIIPSGSVSFYLNQSGGEQYQTYLEELIDFVLTRFNLSDPKLHIAGNSMGGFGSLVLAQTGKYQFDSIGLFSPALSLTDEYLESYPNVELRSEVKSAIKDRGKVCGLANKLFLYCGQNDIFYQDCKQFSEQFEVELFEDDYGHVWDAWDKWIKIYMERI